MTCAKLWPDLIIRIKIRTKRIFTRFQLWAYKPFVKQATGNISYIKPSCILKNHFVHAPSQWETTLHCNIISHWLGEHTKRPLHTSCDHRNPGSFHWYFFLFSFLLKIQIWYKILNSLIELVISLLHIFTHVHFQWSLHLKLHNQNEIMIKMNYKEKC